MPLVIIAEGGRSWPEAEGQSPCDGFCGPEDIHAWGRRLTAEVQAASNHQSQLAPGGDWLGPAAEVLSGQISGWQPGALDMADTTFYDTPIGQAKALTMGGWDAVLQGIVQEIEKGIGFNNRARVMVWEASQKQEPEPKPAPAPIQCPPGFTAVSITQTDGSVLQFCQGTKPEPEPAPEPAPEPEPEPEGGGGGLLLALGIAAGIGAVALYSKRGTISSSVLRSMRK